MNKTKAPRFHISKRGMIPRSQTWMIRGVAIILALILCGIITTMMTGLNPIKVYTTIFEGNFSTSRRIWVLAQNIAILLAISLAMAPAYKMRFWNIGGEGQMLMGGLASAACMILLGDKIPNAVLIALMIVTSIFAGAVWGEWRADSDYADCCSWSWCVLGFHPCCFQSKVQHQ